MQILNFWCKMQEVLQYMEKAFGYLLPPSETSSTVPAMLSSTPSETELLITSTEQQNLARTSSDEVLEEEPVVLGSLEIDQNRAITPVVAAREKPAMPAVDVKLLLHLYRVRLFLSARNLKASKREVKAALNLNRDNVTALLLKAQMEYSRGKYKKASKQLNMCIQRADPGLRAMVLCNLGCVNHRQKKTKSLLFISERVSNFTKSPTAGRFPCLCRHSPRTDLCLFSTMLACSSSSTGTPSWPLNVSRYAPMKHS